MLKPIESARCTIVSDHGRSIVDEEEESSRVEIGRVWRVAGEGPGALHFELVSGDQKCEILLKRSRTPRMFNFMLKHAAVAKEPGDAKGSEI